MTDLPRLAVLFLTYRRTDVALITLDSTIRNMNYPKELIGWYVADDGSPESHHNAVLGVLAQHSHAIIGEHNVRLRPPGQKNTFSAGMGWNRGLGLCHQFSDYVLVLEDDWELDEPLNMEHYIRVMQRREEVGLMSFRMLSIGADVHTVGEDGEVFLRYSRTTQYAYCGHPHVRRARYTQSYGWYAEDRNPGKIELDQDDHYRLGTGPQIWRPATINQWGAWKHIGTEKTWSTNE